MSHKYYQHLSPVIYPPPATAYRPSKQVDDGYVLPPPPPLPLDSPTNHCRTADSAFSTIKPRTEAKTRGTGGFWKRCFDALRCR
ncbi:hypothetical protein PanWU01x14_027990 [Parasponia andersonii]|uniref:Uncharacterized protein n=1 Tax=Parasponia andersonii TaxID=3476 RepID=A0A2P5DV70_PARAD|nr:hypothetical protein PanWU01x14_027990 [Parasponia andersonii]